MGRGFWHGMYGMGTTLYLFLAGAGAGLYAVSCVCPSLCDRAWRRPRDMVLLYKKVQLLSVAAVVLGALFLIGDLTHPELLLYAFNGLDSSALSWGSLLLTLFCAVVVAGMLVDAVQPRGLLCERVLRGAGCVLAFGVMVYTGVFLNQLKAVPFWRSPCIPALFVASSLSSGCALLVMLAATGLRRRELPRCVTGALAADTVLAAAELCVIGLHGLLSADDGPAMAASWDLLVTGELAPAFWTLVVGGLVVPILLCRPRVRAVNLLVFVKCLCTLAGCLLLRVCVMGAGVRAFALG